MTRLLVSGEFGFGNLGDELILEGIIAGARRVIPGVRIVVLSGSPEHTVRSHGVSSLPRGGGAFNRMRRFQELVRADALVAGGGNLRDYQKGKGMDTDALPNMIGWLLRAKSAGVPLMVYAVSVGHVWTPRGKEALRNLAESSDALTVRDRDSKLRLQDLGVGRELEVTADAAFAIGMPRYTGDRSGLVVCLREWYERGKFVEDDGAFERMLGELAKACDHFVETYGEQVVLVPFKSGGRDKDDDVVVLKRLRSLIRAGDDVKVLGEAPSIEEACRLIGSASAVIGMRLHSLILAVALGTPAVAIEYDPKVTGFMSYLGKEAFAVKPQELTAAGISDLIQSIREDEFASVSGTLNLFQRLRESEQANSAALLRVIESSVLANSIPRKIRRSVAIGRMVISGAA